MGTEGASVRVGAAGHPPHPQPIWGHEEELSLQRPTVSQVAVGQPAVPQLSSRPAAGAAHSWEPDRETTGLQSLTERLFQMLKQEDTIRREEDKQRRLQDEARRVQRERDQRRLEAQERAEDARLRERDKQQRLQEDVEQRRVIEALLSSARSIVQSGPAARQSPVLLARDPGYRPPTPDEEPFLFPQEPRGPGRA